MTFAEVKDRAHPDRNADLRMKWEALKEATLALRPYARAAGRELHESKAYAAYLQASLDYEDALRK